MNFLKRIIHRALSWAGFEIRRKQITPPTLDPNDDVYHDRGRKLLQFLREKEVDVLLDVGANYGQYSTAMRELGFTGRIISFEPLRSQFGLLKERSVKDPKWQCYQMAVGDWDGDTVIRVAGNSESSSILPMLELHLLAAPPSAYVGEESVSIRRLDKALADVIEPKDRLMLKLDVQGYELKALQGAVKILSQIHLIDVELTLVPLYSGQPTLNEMLAFFDSSGFVPISIENAFKDPRNGYSLQVDAIFARRETQVEEKKE